MDAGSKKLHSCKECKKHYHRCCVPKHYDFILDSDEDDVEDFFICPKCKTKIVNGTTKVEDQLSDDSTFD